MPVYDTPLTTNDQSLERVLQAGLPVALVVWNGQAGLPGALEDALQAAAKAESGKLLVVRLDVRDNPAAAARWGNTALPALVPVPANTPAAEAIGPLTADLFGAWVEHLVGRGPRPAAPRPASSSAAAGGSTAAGSQAADLTRPVTVTDASFDREVMQSDVPVVVDFWAPWCGPCRMIGPALEKLAKEFDGRVKIAKVNVDEQHQYAAQYGVQGIPTLLLVKHGRVVDRLVGALPEPALRTRIQQLVS